MSDESVDLIITIDRSTARVIRTTVREPGAQPREVMLEVDEVVKLLRGDAEGSFRLSADRTGPDPRRLPGDGRPAPR
jgi:hypothetical protein